MAEVLTRRPTEDVGFADRQQMAADLRAALLEEEAASEEYAAAMRALRPVIGFLGEGEASDRLERAYLRRRAARAQVSAVWDRILAHRSSEVS